MSSRRPLPRLLPILASLPALAVLPARAGAVTLFVDAALGALGAPCTAVQPCLQIAEGVAASAPGDVVDVAAGTYPESGILVPHQLDIVGAGAATTFVDGGASGPIFIVNAPNAPVLLSGMTLRNGDAGFATGGAIRQSDGDLMITSSILHDNRALAGGAISQESNGVLVVLTSVLANNLATATGGAIACNGCGGIGVALSALRNNTAGTTGGAVDVAESTLSVWLSGVSANAADDGGGIHALLAPVTIRDSALSHNSAEVDGGGVWATGNVTLERSTFADNDAGDNGGAVFAFGGLAAAVSNSTFSANTAFCGGGFSLIDNLGAGPNALIGASTFFANESTNAFCGGQFQRGVATVLRLHNSIVDDGGLGFTTNCNLAMAAGTNNLLDDASCNAGAGFNLGAVTFLDPVLAFNGGPTQTHLIGVGSNAIDAGNNATCLNPATGAALVIDQRGLTRPVDATGIGVAICDVGAVEAQ